METINRFFTVPKESFFLFGPRGTGKSTFIKQKFPDALYFDLLLPEVFRLFNARPEHLKEIVLGNKQNIVIIDEIQKSPELLSVVHYLMEEEKQKQFILTGSSPRKLKRTGVNLLGGRALLKEMHPFLASELKNFFNLEEALKYGMLPLICNSDDKLSKLQGYIDLYLREEVQAEGLTRNIGNFSRFLEIVSFSHGSILNISNIARESQIERKTIENYLGILEDLLLSFQIPVFTKRAKRILISHPKFYFFDTGVYYTLRPKGILDAKEELSGIALEGLIAQELRTFLSFLKNENRLYFWRTKSGNEVDFIVYGQDIFWAIEVKNSTNFYPTDLHSLMDFTSDYPECKPIFLYRGKFKLTMNNILIIPCDIFLKEELDPNKY